jgi:hypothetical protein
MVWIGMLCFGATVAPPLLPLDDDVASALLSDLSSIKFEMEKP